MSKMLILSPRCPLPAVDGARVASVQMIRAILQAKKGQGGALIACVPDRPGDLSPNQLKEAFHFENVDVFPRVSLIQRLLKKIIQPWIPFTVLGLDQHEYEAQIHSAILDYNFVVIDGMHAGYPLLKSEALVRKLKDRKVRLIYRAHNVEADIWKTKTAQVPFYLKPFFAFESWAMRFCEKKLVEICDETWTVSDEDALIFRQWVPDAKMVTVRISQPFPDQSKVRREKSDKVRLGFLGSMDWGPNKEGLVWFLKEIWPELHQKRPDFEAVVAGSRASSELTAQLKSTPGLRFLGQVGQVAEFYQQVDWFLVPIFYGSGTRVKVIESCKESVPCFSTSLGVSGVGLEPGRSFIQAETKEEWVQKISALTVEESLEYGKECFIAAQRNFSEQAVGQVISSRLSVT